MSNIVAIAGRPNVGKSTLFNRLIGTRKAIVDEVAGVTRDRHYGKAEWNGIEFSVIDTGGYVFGSPTDEGLEKEIRKQVEIALNEADVILFLVDVTTGITKQDERVASLFRKYLSHFGGKAKTIILVANKADTYEREILSGEFYKLGMSEVHAISSISGRGTGELLNKVIQAFSLAGGQGHHYQQGLPKYAIVGRPNSGKSTLLNTLLGEERAIVTPVAGTTRDSLHTHYKKFNHEFLLIDTAGLRKKRKFDDDVEFYSNLRAIRAIEECDVCLLLLDAQQNMEAQDVNIFRLAERNKKGVVILVNKWDLTEKKTETAKIFEQHVKEKIAPFTDVPVVFISALKKQRIMKVTETAEKVFLNRKKKISDEKLDEAMLPVIQTRQPSSEKGKLVEIYRMAQIPSNIPVFIFYCSNPKDIKESYKRFLENKLREKFDFTGAPVQIYFRNR